MAANSSANELLRKVRKIEIRTRALSHQIFAGEYHSAFKGRGMAFSEVREYQYGDDVRSMDWNVTARLRSPYVKVFEEEREMTVVLLNITATLPRLPRVTAKYMPIPTLYAPITPVT